MLTFSILLSVLSVSVVSLAGVALLPLRTLKSALFWLVAFATGAMLSNVFFHILPEMIEETDNASLAFGLVLAGMLGSFMIEKFIHWHHCHRLDCDDHSHAVGTMVLIGDAAHNITDGILIAAAYLADFQLGLATTIAVILHEIPQEIGDFAVLIHSGYTRSRALLWNFISGLTAIGGALLVITLSQYTEGIEMLLLPLTAGNFLYIAGSDLLPELHRETSLRQSAMQLLWIVLGVAMIGFLAAGHPEHPEEEHIAEPDTVVTPL